jgi:hypothetical protein
LCHGFEIQERYTVRFKKILDGWIQIHERNRKIQDLRELHKDPGKYTVIQTRYMRDRGKSWMRDTGISIRKTGKF